VSVRVWGSLRSAPALPPRPFLKWAGGKGQVVPLIRAAFPVLGPGQRFFEPFLGGGAIFFASGPERATLSDLNRPLIETYGAVKNRLPELLKALDTLPPPKGPEDFYRRRTEFNDLLSSGSRGASSKVQIAALLIWLNHLCFNGLFRVNKAGAFNVPYGFYQNPSIYSRANLALASKALRRARTTLLAADFEVALRPADEGDFVYLDPPYQPLTATSKFTSYTPLGFGEDQQVRLARVVHELVDRGCRVLLSNSATPQIRRLYQDLPLRVVMVPRAINSVGTRRMPVEELLVTSPQVSVVSA
jgi:DNA adenine methylase